MNKRQKKKQEKRHSILRVRKTNNTERGRLSTMVIRDKKKDANKKKCRGKINYE
jgi:hypothetical protein